MNARDFASFIPFQPVISEKEGAEQSLADNQLVIPKATWEARNPGQRWQDHGYEEKLDITVTSV